jgi:hypothetical protein
MTQSPKRPVPTGYRLRVDGHLDDHWSAWFGDLTLTHETDGTTSLSGFVPDQAALHGLLMKVRDLGIILISVETINPSDKRARIGSGEAIPGEVEPVEHAGGDRGDEVPPQEPKVPQAGHLRRL